MRAWIRSAESSTYAPRRQVVDAVRPSRSRRFVRWAMAGVAAVICLAYIGLTFNWSGIAEVLHGTDLATFFAGGCTTILVYFVIRTLRWSIVLRAVGVRPSFGSLYRWSVFSQAAIVVTPFQSGEVLKVEMLHGAGHSGRVDGYGGFAVERMADVAVLASMAAVAMVFSLERPGAPARAVLVVALGAVLLIAIAALLARHRLGFVTEMARSALVVGRQPAVVVPVLLYTVASWSVVALGWLFTLRSIGIDLSFAQSAGLVSVVTIVNVASLIPGAVGISEVGITESLVRLGYGAAQAQAGALLIRAYALEVLALAAIHFVVWRLVGRRPDGGGTAP